MKIRILKIATIVAFAATLTAGAVMAGCGKSTGPAETYYLSAASSSWATYSAARDVPSDVRFSKSAGTYTLTVSLEADDAFTVNRVGSSEKIGFDAVFSTRTELAEGENNQISVTATGSYALTLDVSDGALLSYTYTQTAKEVSSVAITHSVATLSVGEAEIFSAKVVYSDNSEGTEVVWTSGDPAVATVSETGLVTAVAAGSTAITASAGGKSAEVTVTVTNAPSDNVAVTGVSLNKEELLLELDGEEQLVATITPENATNKALLWASSNSSVVTVDSNGVVRAVNSGTATVTVSTVSGGKTAACAVTVRRPVSSVSMRSTLTVVEESSKTLSVSFLPATATNRAYTYEVTVGSQYIAVTDDGEGNLTVVGVARGTAVIKVTSEDNPEATAECTVTVRAAGTVVADLSAPEVKIPVGGSEEVAVLLDGADITSLTCKAGSASIARVSVNSVEEGLFTVTGVAIGSTEISVIVNGTHRLSCNVLVASDYYYVTGSGSLAGEAQEWDSGLSEEEASVAKRLLNETERGVYTLTRRFNSNDSFQIIFPDLDTDWETAITYYNYYKEASGASGYFSTTGDSKNVVILYAGVYTVKLDLASASPYFTVLVESVDVESLAVSVASGSATTLTPGGDEETKLVMNVNPTYATVKAEDVSWWLDPVYRTWLILEPSEDGRSCVVKLDFAMGTEPVSVKVYCSVGGLTAYYALGVLPENVERNPVTQITFEQEVYAVNVHNEAWRTIVRAFTNEDATVQGVKYTKSEVYVTVDATTGVVTATRLGVYTITATSVDDPTITATTKVIFYSDVFFLAGLLGDADLWGNTETGGYTFRQESLTLYKLENVELWRFNLFQIVFLGIDASWSASIKNTDLRSDSAIEAYRGQDSNFATSARAYYTITLDLEQVSGKRVYIEKTGDITRPDPSELPDFKIEVRLYGTGSLWVSEDAPLAKSSATISPSTGAMTVTVRLPAGLSVGSSNNIDIVTVKNGAMTWYQNHPGITIGGGAYNVSGNGWRRVGSTSCRLFYYGSYPSSNSYAITVTVDEDGRITDIQIELATASATASALPAALPSKRKD